MARSGRKKLNKEHIYIPAKLKAKFEKMDVYPLTSIEAPIGYGKSKSCLEYLKNSGKLYMWCSIAGRESGVFWRQFCGTLELIDRESAAEISSIGVPEDRAAVEKCVDIIGGIKTKEPVIVVIDTTYDSFSENFEYMLELIARRNSQGLHFVIISRCIFRNNREELRMKHMLLIIDVYDLMFDRDDVLKYYESCGLYISTGDAERMRRATDGWIAALYLALIHYDPERGRLDVPDQIQGIFSQTLWNDYTEEQKTFLESICPFRVFSMEQAGLLSGRNEPEELMMSLVNSCGFIWLVPDDGRFQMNRLYREYLIDNLDRGDPKFRNAVYRNAAECYFKSGDFGKSAYFSCRAGDYEKMITAFEKDMGEHLCADDVPHMMDLFDKCPEDMWKKHFLALMILVRHLNMCGMKRDLDRVMELLESEDFIQSIPEQERDRYGGEMEMLRGHLSYKDPSLVSVHHMRAARKLGHTAQTGRMTPFTFGSPSVMFIFYNVPGKLESSIQKYMDAGSLYYKITDNNGRGSEYMFEAEAQFAVGNVDKADILSHKAGTVAARYNQTGTGICAYFMQVRISIMRGDSEKGMEYLRKINDLASRVSKRVYSTDAELCEAYVYAIFNQLKYVADWIERGDFFSEGENDIGLYDPARDFAYVVYSRILIDSGEYSKYLGMADELINEAVDRHCVLAQIYYHVYCAAAYRKMSMDDEAGASLRRAIRMAMQDGIIMPFAENGRILNDLYDSVELDEEEKEFSERCLALFNKYEKNMNVVLRTEEDSVISVLTRREQEISLLVADGKTNMQIAKELNIAEITVKKSLSNIYSRLGIPNRASLIKLIIS